MKASHRDVEVKRKMWKRSKRECGVKREMRTREWEGKQGEREKKLV